MRITISIALAYALAGISQVTQDLKADPVHRPIWAIRPTVGQAIFVAATWPLGRYLNALVPGRVQGSNAVDAIVITLGLALDLAILTGFVWCCITASAYAFESAPARIASVVVLLAIGGRFVLPWLMLAVNAVIVAFAALLALRPREP